MACQNLFKILSCLISMKFFLLSNNVPDCFSLKVSSPLMDLTNLELSSTNNTLNSSVLSERKKRQDGGGSTNVIGSRITRDATAGDWLTANFAANNADSASRAKRSIEKWYDFKKFPSTSFELERRKRPLTRTQELFSCVNQDFYYAKRFQGSKEIQGNSYLRNSLVVNQHGVKCHQVCDSSDNVGFGLLGLCTDRYCRCDTSHYNQHVEYICPSDKVFDPITLWCQSPSDTILCSDPQTVTLYGPPAVLQVWGTSEPNYIHGWKKWK